MSLPIHPIPKPHRVGIVGGGPGGLVTAWLLQKRSAGTCVCTLFEADRRLGGKILTPTFDSTPAHYEAGAAELYDYSQLGPDPLRELIAELGLTTSPMCGPTVILGGHVLTADADIVRAFGPDTLRAIDAVTRKSRRACSPAEYYESDWKADNEDPLARKTFADFLDEIPDEAARKYIEVAVHSDLATEPHRTSATYGIQNWLMNDPRYMRLYTIDGGIERLPRELARRIDAAVRIGHRVRRIGRTPRGTYRIEGSHDGGGFGEEFDSVVVALPMNALPRIDWQGADLAKAMRSHVVHYDHPAHYLRVSVVFETPFWRDRVSGSFFMSDAFGGCCLYDDGLRCPATTRGILGWLIAGEAAVSLGNRTDVEVVAEVLASLPPTLRPSAVVEAKVHRWLGCVNGMPMGYPVREPDSRHQPDPLGHPGLYLVGDYLFDSTLNGVLDSADTAVEFILDELAPDAPIAPVEAIFPKAATVSTPELVQ